MGIDIILTAWYSVRPSFVFFIAALMLFGFIYCYWYDVWHKYVTGKIPTHLINDDTVGRLIRAGERGVLFADDALIFPGPKGFRNHRTVENDFRERATKLGFTGFRIFTI
jgi:hypothetical protein